MDDDSMLGKVVKMMTMTMMMTTTTMLLEAMHLTMTSLFRRRPSQKRSKRRRYRG